MLGSISGISSPGTSVATSAGGDSTQQDQEQQQDQAEKKSDKKGDGNGDEDSGVDSSLGLINTGPVQLKTDLLQPVTSGGMDTMMNDNPEITD